MGVLNDYKGRLKQSSDLAYPHWDRSIENYKHYLGKLDASASQDNEGGYPFESKMSVSISYEIVETIMPRIIGKDPEWTTMAIEPSDVPYEQTAKLALDSQYNNPKLELMGEPIYLKLYRGVKENLITGNAVLRAFWRRETTKRVQYTASLTRAGIKDSTDIVGVLAKAHELGASNEVRYNKKYVESPFLDDFDVRHLPFFMYFGDFNMVETGRFRYHIERDYMTFEELADEAKLFGYDKSVMTQIQTEVKQSNYSFTPELAKDFLYRYNSMFKTMSEKAFETDNDKIPLLIVDKMWDGAKVHVIVNEKYIPTNEGMPNPYDVQRAPFIFMHDIPIPHSYHSRGEIDSMKKIEDGINDNINMRFDNLLQSMLNIWLVDPNLVADGDEFVPIPNSITSAKDVDKAVRVISGKDVTPNAYKEADSLYGIIQRITGVNDYVKGEEGETLAGRTYGGLRLVQEAANARFIVKSRLFEKVTLKSLGYFMLEMSRQFINKDRIVRLAGDSDLADRGTIKAGELKQIKGYLDIKAVPNATQVIDQQAEAIKMNGIADRFVSQKGPFANIPPEVYDKFLLKYLQAYNITDAVYWVRMIREARQKNQKEAEQAAAKTPPKLPPEVPQMPGGSPALPPTTVPTMQSDQVSAQPNPLEQLLNSQNLPGALPIQ